MLEQGTQPSSIKRYSLGIGANKKRKRSNMSKGSVKARLYIGGLKSLFAEMAEALDEVEQTGKMPMELFVALEDVKGAVDLTLTQLKASVVKCCDHGQDCGNPYEEEEEETEEEECDDCGGLYDCQGECGTPAVEEEEEENQKVELTKRKGKASKSKEEKKPKKTLH
jgi:hypothetical protein